MKEKSVDELVAELMVLPKMLLERTQENTELIQVLNLQIERLVKLIAGLHDIDLDAIRAELS